MFKTFLSDGITKRQSFPHIGAICRLDLLTFSLGLVSFNCYEKFKCFVLTFFVYLT